MDEVVFFSFCFFTGSPCESTGTCPEPFPLRWYLPGHREVLHQSAPFLLSEYAAMVDLPTTGSVIGRTRYHHVRLVSDWKGPSCQCLPLFLPTVLQLVLHGLCVSRARLFALLSALSILTFILDPHSQRVKDALGSFCLERNSLSDGHPGFLFCTSLPLGLHCGLALSYPRT